MSIEVSKKLPDKRSKLVPVGYNPKEEEYICINPLGINGKREYISTIDIVPIPYLDLVNNQRSMVYISGVSGCGKSTYARKLIEGYRKRRKDDKRQVYFFTKRITAIDPAFENLKNITFVSIEDCQLFSQLQTEHFKDSIVVFDDITSMSKQHQVLCLSLVLDIAERSRKLNTDIIYISHQTQDYLKTRGIIFESNCYVLFPCANRNSTKKFLTSYGDISKNEIDQMIQDTNLPFCPLVFQKGYPRYYASPRKIVLLN